MDDEIQTPALEAGDEDVSEAQSVEVPETVEDEDGQIDDQPSEAEGDEPKVEDEISPAKARRERRKAEVERLRNETATTMAENAKLRERLAEAERRVNEPAPREADFEDYAEYQAALSAHRSIQALDRREKDRLEGEAKTQQSQIDTLKSQEQAELAQDWASQTVDAKERYSDFDAVVNASDLMITPDMAKIIVTSDMGADIAYKLGSNKAEAARIAKLPPIEQAMALGRLEASVTTAKPRSQTQAPDPINPIRGKATVSKDPGDMSPQEYRAWVDSGGKF